jgi:hypothetical protein
MLIPLATIATISAMVAAFEAITRKYCTGTVIIVGGYLKAAKIVSTTISRGK